MNLLGIVLLLLVTVFASKSYSEGSCNYSQKNRRQFKKSNICGSGTPRQLIKLVQESYNLWRRPPNLSQNIPRDAVILAGEDIPPQIGPEAWVQVVASALEDIGPTQHLIGTQLVELQRFELDKDCNPLRGTATMESYVQAWHERKDDRVWVFIGTYFDAVSFLPGLGWRIEEMQLLQVGGETRFMGSAVAGPN